MRNIDKFIIIIIVALFSIACYHLLSILAPNSEAVKSIFHISTNVMVLVSFRYIFISLRKVPYMESKRRMIVIMSIYPIFRILLNIGFFFKTFRVFVCSHNTDIWGLCIAIFILILLIAIKFKSK